MDFATFLASLVPCSVCAYPNESDSPICSSCRHEHEIVLTDEDLHQQELKEIRKSYELDEALDS